MAESLNATEIAVGSLLAGRGGVWNGGDDCRNFGDSSANAVRIDRNADMSALGQAGTRGILESNFRGLSEGLLQQNANDQFNRICAAISQTDARGADQRFQAELRTNDRLLALQAEVNQNARVAADCCCDLKLQMCEDKAQTLALINAVEGRTIERALNAATAKITQLETVAAIIAAQA
jgi:hypothetical protein